MDVQVVYDENGKPWFNASDVFDILAVRWEHIQAPTRRERMRARFLRTLRVLGISPLFRRH